MNPSPSATKDKPNGAGVDGLGNADQDKAFYENLPFHGIQDAPNKCALHGGSQLSLHADASSGYGSTRSQPTRVGPLVTHQEEHFLSLRTTPRRPRQAIPLHFRQFQTLKIEANARGPMVVATVTTTLKTPPPPKKPQRNEKPNRASPPPLPTPNHLQIPPVAAPRKSTPPSKSKHTYQNIPISPNNTQENGKTPSDHKSLQAPHRLHHYNHLLPHQPHNNHVNHHNPHHYHQQHTNSLHRSRGVRESPTSQQQQQQPSYYEAMPAAVRLEYQQPYYVGGGEHHRLVYADLLLRQAEAANLSASAPPAPSSPPTPHIPRHSQQHQHQPQHPLGQHTDYAILKFHDVGQEIDV